MDKDGRPKGVSGGDQTVLDCGTALKIDQIQSYYVTLKDFLTSSYQTITFEGGALEKVDTAPLQLLVCFMRAAQQQGLHCQWGSVSPTLLENARLLGLHKLLQLTSSG
ncbi:MAG: STAS domain-containing protein [Gammaproteobacteria bacterium]|nr:MAG: STAS domain-containing protein [Gammaproteobacteria bacterium]